MSKLRELRELSKTCGYLEEELSWPSKEVEEQGHSGKSGPAYSRDSKEANVAGAQEAWGE